MSGLHPVELPVKFLEIFGGVFENSFVLACLLWKYRQKRSSGQKNCLKTTQLLTRFHWFWSTLENFPKFLANWPLASILQKLCTASYRFSLNDYLIKPLEFRYLIAWSYLTSGILKSLAVWLPRFGSMIEIIGQKYSTCLNSIIYDKLFIDRSSDNGIGWNNIIWFSIHSHFDFHRLIRNFFKINQAHEKSVWFVSRIMNQTCISIWYAVTWVSRKWTKLGTQSIITSQIIPWTVIIPGDERLRIHLLNISE